MLVFKTPDASSAGGKETAEKTGESYVSKEAEVGALKITDTLLFNIEKDKTETVQRIERYAPGGTNYDPKIKGDIERHWHSVITEINGVDTLIQHFLKLKKRVGESDFTLKNNPRWNQRMKVIYESFKSLNGHHGLESTLGDIHQKEAEEMKLTREYIEEDLEKIIDALVAKRNTYFEKLHGTLKDSFKARLEYLEDTWNTKPPKGYEGVKDNYIAEIKKARELMNKLPVLKDDTADFTKGKETLNEYDKAWEDIARLEDRYKYATEIDEDSFDIKTLEDEFSDAEKKHKEKMDEIADEYMKTSDEVISDLHALIAEINRADEEIITKEQKEDQIKGLEVTLKKVEQSRDLRKISHDALYSEELWQEDDPDNPGQKRDAQLRHKWKKGLKHQLEMLKSEPFNEVETRALALGLHESIEKFKLDLDAVETNMKLKLPDLKEKIRLMREGLNPVRPTGRWKLTMMSPYDAYRAFEIIQEWTVRRYKRASTERVGAFGSQVLSPLNHAPGPLSPLRTLPNEFDKEVEKAEDEEMNNYKAAYDNKDAWEIEQIAHVTTNKDELKACLYLLAERGRLRWDKVELIKQFNRFQKTVFIPEDSAVNYADISKFFERLDEACGMMWDFDTFRELKSKNSSSYSSKKEEYEQNCHEWAESPGGLGLVIEGLLNRYKEQGEDAKVDPLLYEKIVDYCIKYGKISPEDKMYYLVQGIGTGLLAPDRVSALNSAYINDYPAIDYFGSSTARGKKPTLQDIREVAALDRQTFNTWFHNVAMTMPRVTTRVDKALTQGKELDHDDLTCYLAYMSGTTTENVLKEHSGRFILPATGVQNATVGMLQYIDNMAEHFDEMPRNTTELRRFIDSVSRFHGVTKGYMYAKSQSYFRLDVNSENEGPRSDGTYAKMYGRDGMSTKEYMGAIWEYFKVLDEEFFESLHKGRIKTDDDAKALVSKMKLKYGDKVFGDKDVNSVDTLYQAAGDFAGYLIEKEPNKIQKMFKTIQVDHRNTWKKMKDKEDYHEPLLKDLSTNSEENVRRLRKAYDPTQGGSETKAQSYMQGGVVPDGQSSPYGWMSPKTPANNNWSYEKDPVVAAA